MRHAAERALDDSCRRDVHSTTATRGVTSTSSPAAARDGLDVHDALRSLF
jgi:hypothetical protein